MRYLYSFSIRIYAVLLKIASLFVPKAKKWVDGRKNIFDKIKAEVEPGNIVWFHAASVGEFEQARPLIEVLKNDYPNKKILITFFSPSGYELRKDYELADYVFYLPIDTPQNAFKFLEAIKPETVFFIKYEFWFNYINEIHSRLIPLYLVSGIFREKQHFFKWYGSWFAKHLPMFKHIYVQDKASAKLLGSLKARNFSISGDTRFDRVYQNTLSVQPYDTVAHFVGDSKILLAGSSWPQDEDLLIRYLINTEQNIKLIIAPHEIHENHLISIEKSFRDFNPIRWSQHQSKDDDLQNSKVLIIDSVGKLMHLYQYADVAYIGGGFGVGIHNILEAACFGKPIAFGPNYQKFKEARDLIELKGAFSISNYSELKDVLDKLFIDSEILKQKSDVCLKYIKDNIGATEIIMKEYSSPE
ncbi:MAG: 3-deoxy-D-manno-octulosonic acid transferase [Bacteroidetes bacterium 4572_112]|nr:MAG: 3-deoxy-D-manno-octulosonic acid transferase [Bacteroidetes bacterium 4572_112]